MFYSHKPNHVSSGQAVKDKTFRRINSKLVLPSVMAAILTVPGASLAITPNDTPLNQRLQRNHSVHEIARQITKQHKWRILAAEPKVENSKTLYQFKLLNKKRGRVKVIVIDPNESKLNTLEQIKLQ